MSLQEEQLDIVLSLAQLDISREEKTQYLTQLQSILNQMTALDQFDLSHVSPFGTDSLPPSELREDKVEPSKELMLGVNAPHWELNCFRVPKII